MGTPLPKPVAPWFWSDQYESKLQIAGISAGADRQVARKTSERVLSVWSFRNGRFLAVDVVNDPLAFKLGAKFLEAGFSPDPAALADPRTDLKSMIPLMKEARHAQST